MGNNGGYSAIYVSDATGMPYGTVTYLCLKGEVDARKIDGRWNISDKGLGQARKIYQAIRDNGKRRRGTVKKEVVFGKGDLTFKEVERRTGVNVHTLEALCRKEMISFKGNEDERRINVGELGKVKGFRSPWYKENFDVWNEMK
jgi:hypothetical protein